MAASAKITDSIYLNTRLHRLPNGGGSAKLGPPIKYPAQNNFVSTLVKERFERGDPASFAEVMVALRIKYLGAAAEEEFQTLIKKDHSLRVWLRRVLKRIRYSESLGTISQKVPTDWLVVARTSSARIRQAAVDNSVDNILNADETFVQFYCSDRVLVPCGTKRVGTLVPVENDKKGVTLMVSASLLSSSLLPPFIIDTGEYGADLMRQWQHYTKSTVIFNKNHWMTQYTFVLYLEWLQKMFPGQRLLLVVDRSTTHYGKMITDWLAANHSSTVGFQNIH